MVKFKDMKTHQMKLTLEPFEQIASGEKIIESRLYDEKRQRVSVGDYIEFSCVDDMARKIKAGVRALYQYGSFDDLFSDFPSAYFGGASKEELLTTIKKFYSEEDQETYGAVGIRLLITR